MMMMMMLVAVGCFVLSAGATATDARVQPTSAFADFTFASFVEAENSFIEHCRVVHCREDLCTAEKTCALQRRSVHCREDENCAEHETWTDDSGRLLGATRAVEQD